MAFNLESLTYVGIVGILLYQVGAGVVGLLKKEDSLRTFQLLLFLLFFASELSRSFFPVFVRTLTSEAADKTLAMALPQIVWGLSAMIATPYGWLLAKKTGKKNVLMLSALATAGALAITACTGNYWVMLGCRALVSIGYGVANIVAVIYLSEKGMKASVMTVLLAAIATSSICGNALGGLLTSHLSYGAIFGLSAVAALLAAAGLQLTFRDSAPATGSKAKLPYKKLLTNRKIQLFAILNTMPYRFVLTGFVLYLIPVVLTAHHLELKQVGQVMMVYFLLNYALVKPVAAFLDRFNSYRLVAILSTILTGAGLMLFGYGLESLWTIFAAVCVISVGMALNSSIQIPIVPVVFQRECEEFGRETLLAYFRTVERVGSVIGPLLTALFYKMSPGSVLNIIGLLLMGIAALLWVLLAAPAERTPPTVLAAKSVAQ